MKTIGLIGGMSWESTLEYYRVINTEVARECGGFHSARCVLVSVDFADIEEMQKKGNWSGAGRAIGDAAAQCEAAGADFLVLCTNTMHKIVDQAQQKVGIPFLHIADATAHRIRESDITTVALLGTRYTMEDSFYRGRLEDEHGLNVLIPGDTERETVHRVIYEELVHGRIEHDSRSRFVAIIEKLVDAGAKGVIAGCTEIGLLIGNDDSPVPVFDTARIHAEEAVKEALQSSAGRATLPR